MRSLTVALATALCAVAAGAQEREVRMERTGLPRDVAREATRLYNEPAALRSTSRVEIDEDRVIDGDVAVLDGPLYISGRVKGRVLAINSDVIMRSTARVDGDLLVVGGEVEGRHAAFIGGETRIYRQRLAYTRDGERIASESRADTREETETGWWRQWERQRRRSGSSFHIASAGAYNRVEGLPINLGPQIYTRAYWGSAKLDAYAVVRTETSFQKSNEDIGHNVNLELRLGRVGGPMIGGRAYNVVEPTENWQLSNLEAGLAAFVFHRDYRDYFERHGGTAYAGLFFRRRADVAVSYSEERWRPRSTETPWFLFGRSGLDWRPNPGFDAGLLHLLNSTLRVDTRNDSENPWSGWYVLADLENGLGNFTAFGPRSAPLATPGGASRVRYSRGFLDFRRYNRVSPDAQLNFRLVGGAWLNGDPLPLQRRFSVDGSGALPGYDFRTTSSENTLTCISGGAVAPGVPGQCDRMALAQVEYRGSLHFDLFTDWEDDHYNSRPDGVWVFFADAGRGWLVGTPSSGSDQMTYAKEKLPELSTFKTDLGVGLDFDVVGLYVAKAMSAPRERANVFVRIRHRF